MGQITTPNNFGPEFDFGNITPNQIRLKLGSGLAIQPDGTIVVSLNTEVVDQSFLAAANVTGDANAVNTLLTLTSQRTDAGWAIAGNEATYTGTPDKVIINASTFFTEGQAGALARINPELELLRNGVVVATSASAYQRHATGHNSSSNTIAFEDPTPGTNPVYSLRSQEGSDQNDVMNVDIGSFSVDAIEKVTVIAP